MPPAAMFCQSLAERAVGFAANGRNVAGSTPSTFTNTPSTWIRPAATGTAATTPPNRSSVAASPVGSAVGATTSRSAWSSRPSRGNDWAAADGSGFAAIAEVVGDRPAEYPHG